MTNKRFHLPRAAYEILPLIYLSLGATSLFASHSISADIFGALLIARGLYTSLLRINYRSPHQALSKSPTYYRGK